MNPYKRNVIVGAVVLVGLGMLGWMILQFAGKAATFFLTTGIKITLTTDRADGVAEGSAVTYRGVNVGRVTGVRRQADSEDILIEALINANPPLPADLQGTIKQTSLLGASASISLDPVPDDPEPAATTQGGGATTRGGGSATTRGSDEPPRYLAEGAPLKATYVPDITSLADRVRDTLDSVQEVIADPQMREDIRASLANVRETTESANRLGARMEKLTGRLDELAEESTGTVGEVRQTVEESRAELRKLSASLDQRMQQVAETLQHFQSVARKIDEGQGTAGALVNDPQLYQGLADTAAELNLTIKDLRRLLQQWEEEGIIKL